MKPRLAVILLLAALLTGAEQLPLAGHAAIVFDGDTFLLAPAAGGRKIKVRLFGIDAPESTQPYGAEATRKLRQLLASRTLRIQPVNRDQYGRLVAIVFAGDADAGLELLRCGLAWHYRRYSEDARYADAETEARCARVGLWRDPTPVPPWDFRHSRTPASKPRRIKR